MILNNFIVEQVIGLVDGAEHNAEFFSVCVLTTTPAISHDSPIALHRQDHCPRGAHPPESGTSWPSQPVWNQSGCTMPTATAAWRSWWSALCDDDLAV